VFTVGSLTESMKTILQRKEEEFNSSTFSLGLSRD
jgi:hypothetical protein